MQDGSTRKLSSAEVGRAMFLSRHDARLVAVEGPSAGLEVPLRAASLSIGRGPGVDVTVDDEAMSREHVSVELGRSGFRVRDLGSTNGVMVNGRSVADVDLQDGDRVQVGEHTFQYVVEETHQGGTYEL